MDKEAKLLIQEDLVNPLVVDELVKELKIGLAHTLAEEGADLINVFSEISRIAEDYKSSQCFLGISKELIKKQGVSGKK